jgi:hypothetical protein
MWITSGMNMPMQNDDNAAEASRLAQPAESIADPKTTIKPEPKRRIVAIATPAYGSVVTVNYNASMINLIIASTHGGFPDTDFVVLDNRESTSLLPQARNNMVAEFFARGLFTHLLWVDSDVGFNHQDLLRMIDADLDVVAGIYPLKQILLPDYIPAQTSAQFLARYMTYAFARLPSDIVIPPDGFLEVDFAPTGFMLIKREVLVKMMEHYPQLKYIDGVWTGDLAKMMERYTYGLFDTMIDETGRFLSEDFAFCHRWRAMGGKVHADVHSKLSHQGVHLWVGDVMASLRAYPGCPASVRAGR